MEYKHYARQETPAAWEDHQNDREGMIEPPARSKHSLRVGSIGLWDRL